LKIFARRPLAVSTRPRRHARPRPRPVVSRHTVAVPGLPPALHGLTVAHLSDFHVQRMVRPRHLDRAVELVNELRPELCFFTGDYVCFHPGAIPRLGRSLAALDLPAAPIATLGNHDHWCDAPGIRRTLERIGIRVLQNEHAVIEVRGERLCVVGVDDSRTGHHDPARAFAGAPRLPTFALTHDPRAVDLIRPHGPLLLLAGHTHGGQVKLGDGRIVRRVAARYGQRYLEGLFPLPELTLFVNRGLGAALPVRFRTPPEVALLTLVPR
jgi:predicted MPP superfamily phosphohydrolase